MFSPKAKQSKPSRRTKSQQTIQDLLGSDIPFEIKILNNQENDLKNYLNNIVKLTHKEK